MAWVPLTRRVHLATFTSRPPKADPRFTSRRYDSKKIFAKIHWEKTFATTTVQGTFLLPTLSSYNFTG